MADEQASLYAEDDTAERRPGAPSPNGADPLVCPECQKRCKTPAGLGAHRRVAHGGSAAKAKAEPGTKEKAPKPKAAPPRRASLDQIGTGICSGLAFAATRAGRVPLGRVLTLEAPSFGPAFEEAAKGTIVDKVLQPFARLGGRGVRLGRKAALIVATEAFVSQPSTFTQGAFVQALRADLPDIVRHAKAAKKEQERLEADLSEFAEVFGLPPGAPVSIETVAYWILGVDGSAPQEEPAGAASAA